MFRRPIKVYWVQVVLFFSDSGGRLYKPNMGLSVVAVVVEVGSLPVAPPPAGVLVDVLGEPAEALSVALPLQHAAHEQLQWSRVQLLHGNVALETRQTTSGNIIQMHGCSNHLWLCFCSSFVLKIISMLEVGCSTGYCFGYC